MAATGDKTRHMQTNQTANYITDQVLQVMKILTDKMKVALVLPQLVQDPEKLTHMMSEEDKENLLKYCEEFLSRKDEEESSNLATEIDYRLFKAIDLAYKNSGIRNTISEYLQHLSSTAKELLEEINVINKIAELRLNTEACAEILREKTFHRTFQSNNNPKKLIDIAEKQQVLKEKESIAMNEVAKISKILDNWREKIKTSQTQHVLQVQEEMRKAKIAKDKICNANETRQVDLRQEAETWRRAYSNKLKENLMAEQKLRERKTRYQAQLVGWIKKYDEDMQGKVVENEDLKILVTKKRQELEDFMEEFTRQEEEYYTIFSGRKENSVENKIMMFSMNRAARIIQMAWRMFKKLQKTKHKAKGKEKRKGAVKSETVNKEKKVKREQKGKKTVKQKMKKKERGSEERQETMEKEKRSEIKEDNQEMKANEEKTQDQEIPVIEQKDESKSQELKLHEQTAKDKNIADEEIEKDMRTELEESKEIGTKVVSEIAKEIEEEKKEESKEEKEEIKEIETNKTTEEKNVNGKEKKKSKKKTNKK